MSLRHALAAAVLIAMPLAAQADRPKQTLIAACEGPACNGSPKSPFHGEVSSGMSLPNFLKDVFTTSSGSRSGREERR